MTSSTDEERGESYDFVVVLDEPRQAFDCAAAALREFRGRFASNELVRFDLYCDAGAPLVVVLHFDWEMFGPDLPPMVLELARRGRMRVLETMRLKPEEREHFFATAVDKLTWRFLGVTDPAAALYELRRRIVGEPLAVAPAPEGVTPMPLTVQYASADEFLAEYAQSALGRSIFIPSTAMPLIGQLIDLTIATQSGQGPIRLSARVIYTRSTEVATPRGEAPGFGVGFLLPPTELSMFESFQIAVRRGAPWPERSGRRYERFPMQLLVEYKVGTETRREHTTNISRGGMFVDSFDPPPVTTILSFSLVAPASTVPAQLLGEVMHVTTADEATRRGLPCGAGVRFLDAPAAVLAKLTTILAAVEVHGNRRALVVDDDRFSRQIVGNVLRLGGFEILEAEDGKAAFELLLEELLRLDVLVVDLYMPGMLGVEPIERIRGVGGEASLAIVAVTAAELDDKVRSAAIKAGADDVLSKSMSPEQVLLRIEEIIAAKSAARGEGPT